MFFAGLLALAASQPAPSASTPPKQIIEVHSQSTLCTTLNETVAPVLAGLMKNDEVIGSGERVLANMMYDRANGSQRAGMDRLQLENASLALVHNLAAIDGLLADSGKFPPTPRNDAERTANDIKTALQNVATSQKQKLNEIYGMMDTDELGTMQTVFPAGNPGFGPISQQPDPDMQKETVKTAPPAAGAGFAAAPGAGLAAAPGDAQPSGGTETGAVSIAALEDRASAEIARAAAVCGRTH